jgi:DNA-binding winged helix-turn-helix (wHTH) protein/Tfp pilus assembly protein PilF/TolB-like protein
LPAASHHEPASPHVEPAPIICRFADFRLDEANRLLTRDGEEVSVPARSFDCLLMLVRRHGQLVTKSEMMDAVWANSFVEESNLTVAVSTLRRALGEYPNDRKYIQTVSGRGYRFIGHVEDETPAVVEAPEVAAQAEGAAVEAVSKFVETGNPVSINKDALDAERPGRFSRWVVAAVVLCLIAAGVGWYVSRPAAKLHAIAILPMTGTGVDDYVLLGLTDTLISRVEDTIEVRPMSSVLRYSTTPTDLKAVGREQNADAVVTSSIKQNADETHLTIKLVRAADEKVLWSKTFTAAGHSVSRLEIAAGDALDAQLAKRADRQAMPVVQPKPPVNEQAYQLYMRGRYFWNRRTEEGLRQSISYFRQAIDADPNYALAYAGLADSYALLSSFSIESGRTAIPDARAAALSAIQLDPTLAEPHASLGMIYFFTDWDGRAAEREFERAIALNPNYATAHHWYALDLAAMGRFPQALYEIHRAQELNPLSLIIDTNVGWIEYLSGNNQAAMLAYKKVLELDPLFARALTRRGIAEIQTGDAKDAVADLTKALGLSDDSYILGLLGEAEAESGNTAEAQRMLKQLQLMAKTKYVPPFALALVYLGLKEKPEAIKALQESVQDRSTSMVYAKVDPSLDAVRSDPAFQAMVAKMQF